MSITMTCCARGHMYPLAMHACNVCAAEAKTVTPFDLNQRNHAAEQPTVLPTLPLSKPYVPAQASTPLIPVNTPSFVGHDAFGFEANLSVQEVPLDGIDRSAAERVRELYRPIGVIAEGGMGKVFLAEERATSRRVALKVMLGAALRNSDLVKQFVREAVVTARLSHPHVIPIHDIGFLRGGDLLYYTMAYVPGKPYADCAPEMSLRLRLSVLRAAALAVNSAHEVGLWHRDLKPGNILVGAFRDAYVIDWGLVSVRPGSGFKMKLPEINVRAQEIDYENLPPAGGPPAMAGGASHSTNAAFNPQHRRGMLIGTPGYMAPEQVNAYEDEQGAHSDVWAFGVMLYEALADRHPYVRPNSSVEQILEETRAPQIQPLNAFAPNTPGILAEACQEMLIVDHAKRPAELSRFAATVSSYLDGAGDGSTELSRYRRKNELLAELVNTSVFRVGRRKKLLVELATI